MAINAIRLRTTDPQDAQGRFRYLQAVNGGDSGLLATRVESPGQWETFLFEPPTSWPLSSGDQLSMNLCDTNWDASDMLVRVDHDVRVLRPSGKDPPMVTYVVGGPGMPIWVRTGLGAGYPAYPGDDPAERIFDIVKQGGGPINTGNSVSLRINSNLGGTFFFRVTGPQDKAPIHGDGTGAALSDTTFIAEFVDVRSGMGACGGVNGNVTRAAGNQPIPGALLEALNVPGNGSYNATTDSNGNFTLSNPTDSCVPAGNIKVRAAANRFQTKTIDPVVVPSGASVNVPIQLDCTQVKVKVVDNAGLPLPGQGVWLLDSSNNQLRDLNEQPYDANTGIDGTVTFNCVPHGTAFVETDADSSVHLQFNIPPEGTTATIVVQNTCGNIVGKVVTDLVSNTGIPNAAVRIVGTMTTTTTDANGNFQFTCVRPAGPKTVRASEPSCGAATGTVDVPTSGNSQPLIIALNCSAVVVDSIVAILQWAMQPTDLDAHLSGPDGQGGRFHLFFGNLANPPVNYANLDRDDVFEFGPETLSITKSGNAFIAGDYHVWVHNYIRSTFAGSNAVVTVVRMAPGGIPTQLSRQEVQFATGDQADDFWHVVNLDVTSNGTATVTVVQTLLSSDSTIL